MMILKAILDMYTNILTMLLTLYLLVILTKSFILHKQRELFRDLFTTASERERREDQIGKRSQRGVETPLSCSVEIKDYPVT